MYLVTADEMREMDRRTIEDFGLPGRLLMENAGRGAAEIVLNRFHDLTGMKVGVAAGRGNNGGDGYVIARCLAQKGIPVTVYLLARRDQVHGDAAANLRLMTPLGIPVHEVTDERALSRHLTAMRHHTVWVDAILGTGLTTDVKGLYRQFIEFLNNSNRPVLAVDIPSGLDSDTGQPWGDSVRAHTTATFAFAKPGHLLYPGADRTGNLEIIDIGIPTHIADSVGPRQHLISPQVIQGHWKPRAPDAHKGSTGHLLIVAGSPGKTGAAAMAAQAAMRSGAGLVTLGMPLGINTAMESQVLEGMTALLPDSADGVLDESAFEPIKELLPDKKCLAVGPGLGTAPGTGRLVRRLLPESECPIVLDADGLNHLAEQIDILKTIRVPVVLTPHPGEMSRLTGIATGAIQKDRIACSRAFAVTHQVHVVLKGARTVIGHPNGSVFVNPTGNPGMASGGMGDVLTGLIAGLITQGQAVETAIHGGTYIHGAAADTLARTLSPIGFLAGDVIATIPSEINRLLDSDA